MKFKDLYNTDDLANMTEELVFDTIDRIIDEYPDACRDHDCMLDVAAIALNQMPARYRTTPFQSAPIGVFGLVEDIPLEELTEMAEAAVRKAIEQVMQRPKH